MIPIKGSAPSPRVPVVTIGLIVVNALVFLVEVSLDPVALERFIRSYGFVPRHFWSVLIEHPTAIHVWGGSLVSSMFMHGSWGHIIGNMLFLWVFGDGVENRIGRGRFLAFYLLVGVASLLVHGISAPASAVPTVGASGAISGVLGAYLVLYPRSRVLMMLPIFFWPFFFEIPAVFFLGIWFLEQFLFGMVATTADGVGGVAWWAHIGGFVVGALTILALRIGRDEPDERDDARDHWHPVGPEQQPRW